jgi:probable HAF family extracellular repeat protein
MTHVLSQTRAFCRNQPQNRPRNSAFVRLLFIAAIIVLSQVLDVRAQITFTPLGVFTGTRSEGLGVSADGSVVVGMTDAGFFRWTASETMFQAGAGARAVSADGSTVVGGRLIPMVGGEAHRWDLTTGFQGLGDLAGGQFSSAAFGTSADGSVVVGYGTTSNGDEAFRWTSATGMISLANVPGGDLDNIATAISDNGSIVVGQRGPNIQPEAFRWTSQTGMVGLGLLPGAIASTAHGISPDGSVIVGENRFPSGIGALHYEASYWTAAGGWVSLGDFPGGRISSIAYDASADGSVIVGSGQATLDGNPLRAFYWTLESGMLNFQDLLISLGVANLAGWTLNEARGISHDGLTIVGTGIHNGRTEAWVATIPEPSSITLAALAIAGIACYVRSKRRSGMYPRLVMTARAAAGDGPN